MSSHLSGQLGRGIAGPHDGGYVQAAETAEGHPCSHLPAMYGFQCRVFNDPLMIYVVKTDEDD